jgi:hypothetical protein
MLSLLFVNAAPFRPGGQVLSDGTGFGPALVGNFRSGHLLHRLELLAGGCLTALLQDRLPTQKQ